VNSGPVCSPCQSCSTAGLEFCNLNAQWASRRRGAPRLSCTVCDKWKPNTIPLVIGPKHGLACEGWQADFRYIRPSTQSAVRQPCMKTHSTSVLNGGTGMTSSMDAELDTAGVQRLLTAPPPPAPSLASGRLATVTFPRLAATSYDACTAGESAPLVSCADQRSQSANGSLANELRPVERERDRTAEASHSGQGRPFRDELVRQDADPATPFLPGSEPRARRLCGMQVMYL